MCDVADSRAKIYGDSDSDHYYQRSHSIGCDMSSSSNVTNNKKATHTKLEKTSALSEGNNINKSNVSLKNNENWFGGFENDQLIEGITKQNNVNDSITSVATSPRAAVLSSEKSYQRYNESSESKTLQSTKPSVSAKSPQAKKATTAEDDAWNLLID